MSSSVSGVYADALFSLASEHGDSEVQETRSDLRQCTVLFSLNPDLMRLLSLPTLSKEERVGIARKIFGEEGLAVRLLFLLIDHGRLRYLPEITDDFEAHVRDWQNIAEVTVTTATSMNPEQKERLRSALERRLGKTVRIAERIDRSIIGGVIVHYGDTRIDNSLKHRLDTLRQKLTRIED